MHWPEQFGFVNIQDFFYDEEDSRMNSSTIEKQRETTYPESDVRYFYHITDLFKQKRIEASSWTSIIKDL